MTDITKIALSDTELEKVMDSEWILTKHRITKKVYELLGLHACVVKNQLFKTEAIFGHEILAAVPKITRGENYRELPYVILDYPAVFRRNHILALRTMFWWGNFFSVTLLVSGHYKEQFAATIKKKLFKNRHDFYVCVSESEWEHHFEPENYLPASTEIFDHSANKHFIKISLRYELGQWNNMPRLLNEGSEQLLQLLMP